ncbi:YfhD family protein [Paenibacillus protaetiae]|uniref:YfhD family protein n=1 Tax=Paenibacillus protaetiae TaxID=2509456 RepID=UPI001FC901FB|nr:YfhD family protein [Paenibacillus protaetiae]
MANKNKKDIKVNFGDLPVGLNEDVEFSEALADEDDWEAQERAASADERAKQRRDL